MTSLLALFIALNSISMGAFAHGKSEVEQYYLRKYPSWQVKLVQDGVNQVFKQASPGERLQAVRECLSFFHVVFHQTRIHHIQNNFAVTEAYQREIARACERFGVPLAMAYSILTWENSGSVAATSNAACVGVGQLSKGAVYASHAYYTNFYGTLQSARLACETLSVAMEYLLGRNNASVNYFHSFEDGYLRGMADELNVPREHERLRKQAGVADERAIPRCNIEDSVIFMRILLDAYDNRPDIAISAYHNGMANTDDLLRDYLRRHDPAGAAFTSKNRVPLWRSLRMDDISFMSLWNDRRSREMLNGLRTMDGDVTTSANQREALGDESDIYVWKTVAALAGLQADATQRQQLVARYLGEQDESETTGFETSSLVHLAKGIAATPELIGYLRSLQQRYRLRTRKQVVLRFKDVHGTGPHLSGLAVDLISNPVLNAILREDWLFDRIYKTRLPDGSVHVCINPRFGAEFLRYYNLVAQARVRH